MVRVCFVCLGNICRSPTAEGVMRHLVREQGISDHVEIESAGTSGYHVGEPPDHRATVAAQERGVRLSGRSQQFRTGDLDRFDYVLAMDRSNLRRLQGMAAQIGAEHKVHLFRDFDPDSPRGSEVPDPYYGGEQGFEVVLDIAEAGCRGLIDHIRREHAL